MGLVINPTAFRVGYVKAWTDAWYLHRMHYPVFVHKSLEIKSLLQYILLRCYPGQWSHWIYSHATYYYLGNKFQISLFVYDGNDPYQYMRLAKNHKFGWFKKSKFFKFWTKKQLLDLQFAYQRWFLLCQAMNFDFESLTLDSLKWRVKKRHIRKIDGLRKKYGRFWIAREELFIWNFPINMTSEDSYNNLGMTMLNMLFKRYIMPNIKVSFDSKDLGLVDSSYQVLQSHKSFYFFFSYINKILKYIPSYPVGLFNRLTYKACYRIFRMYFIFKPYWINLSKLYELILLFINVNSKIKIYILDNSHLNASYLARYIITCLRAKFDYRDTMIPIKKTLLRIMLAKRWRPIRDIKKKGWEIYFERYKLLMKDRLYFHLITGDMVKMFFYRLHLLINIKRLIKRPKSFKLFNFQELRKSILMLNKFWIYENLFLKHDKMRRFLKLRVKSKFKGSKMLKLQSIIKKRRKLKYCYLKRRVLKKKIKKVFKKFRRRKNKIINLNRRMYSRFIIFMKQIKRLFVLKEILILLNCRMEINEDYEDDDDDYDKYYEYKSVLNNSLYKKLLKFRVRIFLWLLKKAYVRAEFIREYLIRYKRVYKIKPNMDFLGKSLKWKAVRKWFLRRNKRKLFLAPDNKSIMLKEANLNEIIDYDLEDFELNEIIIYGVFLEQYYSFIINMYRKSMVLNTSFYSYEKWFFYNKSFFSKYFNIYKKTYFIRNYANSVFFNFLNCYTNAFKPFVFDIDLYKSYIGNILNLSNVESQFIAKKPKTHDLEEMPLKDKFRRLRILEGGSNSLLYGYKFHFVGRFTRKQKAASLWFAKGANSVSSMRVDVDYGFYTLALRYSACTLKVWLYKNRGYSYKYGYRLV